MSVLVTGKVTSLRRDTDSCNFSMNMDSIKLQIEEKNDLASDFAAAKQGRKL